MKLPNLALLFVAFASLESTASAQDAARAEMPYSALHVRVSMLAPIGIGRLAPYYSVSSGGIIEATTPFNFGEFGVAVGWLPFTRVRAPGETAASSNENFRAFMVGVGWETPKLPIGRVQTSAGIRASTFRMAFSDTIVDPGIRSEDELQLGVSAQVMLPLTSRLRIGTSLNVSRIFLHVPLNMTTATAGVEWKFSLAEKFGRWFR